MTTIAPPTPVKGTASPGACAVHQAAAKRRRRRNVLVGWSFILPNFFGFAALTLVPVLGALALSFTDWDAYSTPKWVGLANFERLWDDANFWAAFQHTFYYAAGHIPLTLLVSLGLAVLLNQKLRGCACCARRSSSRTSRRWSPWPWCGTCCSARRTGRSTSS
ncbi:carbohydrate ABC transporter permease [Streptomyces aureus]